MEKLCLNAAGNHQTWVIGCAVLLLFTVHSTINSRMLFEL